jgi:hypothetical protein
MRTFSHTWGQGDLIYSLPTIRALGGGKLTMCVRHKDMQSLIAMQSYITGTEISAIPRGDTLNVTFDERLPEENIAQSVLRLNGCDARECQTPWLTVDQPTRYFEVLINLTNRWPCPDFPWGGVLKIYGKHAAFVGHMEEHGRFVSKYGPIPYLRTESHLDLARAIAGCDLFIGNQSCPMAIAIGLGRPIFQAVCPQTPDCIFRYPGASYWRDGKITCHLHKGICCEHHAPDGLDGGVLAPNGNFPAQQG